MVLEVVGIDGGHGARKILTAGRAVAYDDRIVKNFGVGVETEVHYAFSGRGLFLVLVADKGCHQNGVSRLDGNFISAVIICRRSVLCAFLKHIGPRNRLTVTVRHTTGDLYLLRKSSDPHRCQKHQRDKKPFHNFLSVKQCARIGALHVYQQTTICLLFLNQIDLEIIEIEHGVDARNSECYVAVLEDIARLSAVLEGKLE